ncbi:MAG: hypothetical protein IJH76_06495 [Clostridia bacterium]|nr:hypothetical protein [Clostridia bacterium]
MKNSIFNIFNESNKEINNNDNVILNNLFNVDILEDYEQKVDTLLNGIIDNNLNKKLK